MLARSSSWRRSIVTSARKLADVMKVSLVNRSSVSPDEVRRIWKEYHSERPHTVAVTVDPWRIDKILGLAKNNPMFIFPIEREGGFFTMVSQFQYNCCMMTTLDKFQTSGIISAVPSLNVTFFNELCQTKGVGLVRAEITNIVTIHEARVLVDRLLYYYSSGESNLVRDFNQRPRQFHLDRYITDSRRQWPRSSSASPHTNKSY